MQPGFRPLAVSASKWRTISGKEIVNCLFRGGKSLPWKTLLLSFVLWVVRKHCLKILRKRLEDARARLAMRAGQRFDWKDDIRPVFDQLRQAGNRIERAGVHTHPRSAKDRSDAHSEMLRIVRAAGYEPYSVSMSNKDLRAGVMGNRLQYHLKDFGGVYREDPITERTVFVMTDVDFHLSADEMDWYLSHARPVFMYTYSIQDAATSTGESQHHFRADQKIVARISGGGGPYTHSIWDYTPDTISSTWGAHTTVFAVEKRETIRNRAIVALLPLRQFNLLEALIIRQPSVPLRHFKPVVRLANGRQFAVVEYKDQLTSRVSIAPVGARTSVQVRREEFDRLFAHGRNALTTLSTGHILSMIRVKGSDPDQDKAKVALLLDYIKNASGFEEVAYSSSTPMAAVDVDKSYHPLTLEERKSTMVPFMSPLDNRGYNPTKCTDSLLWGLRERYEKQIAKPLSRLPSRVLQYSNEFVNEMSARIGSLEPISLEELMLRQKGNARQLRLLREYDTVEDKRNAEPFIKAECYGKCGKDPRIILALQQGGKVSGVPFAVAFGEGLDKIGLSCAIEPVRLADKIVASTSGAAAVIVGDLERADGSVSWNVRENIQFPIYRRVFGPYLEHVKDMVSVNVKVSVRDLCGEIVRTINTEAAQVTGAGPTWCNHTVDGYAFLFITFRYLGFSIPKSWDYTSACLSSGDDCDAVIPPEINPHVFADVWTKVVGFFGMKLTCEALVEWGEPFQFLSRWWNPWAGEPDSMADVERQLKKLHMTPRRPMDPETKIIQKAQAIHLTDGNTPILGPYASYVLKYYGKTVELDTDVAGWWSQYGESVQFPNTRRDWMSAVLADYDFDETRLQAAISSGCSPLEFPLCHEPDDPQPGKEAVTVGDNVIPAATPDDNHDNTESDPGVKQGRKRQKSVGGRVLQPSRNLRGSASRDGSRVGRPPRQGGRGRTHTAAPKGADRS